MLRLNGVLEITVPGAPKEPVFAGGCWLIEMDELNPKISRTEKKSGDEDSFHSSSP